MTEPNGDVREFYYDANRRLTREHDADILLTEDVKSALDPRFRLRELAPATLKGIAEPVRIWAAEGFGDGGASP